MARRSTDQLEVVPEPAPEQPTPEVESAAIEVVDLDTAIQAEATPGEPQEGVSFWFGHIGAIRFSDGSIFVAQRHREFITDKALIEKIKQAADNPSNAIFIE